MSSHVSGAAPRMRLVLARYAGFALLGAAFAAAVGCGANPVPVNDDILKTPRYLRYTVRSEAEGFYQRTWRSNYISMAPTQKPGAKVDFLGYTNLWVDLSFNGLKYRMYYRDLPFPTEPEGLRKFVEKHFAATREELNLEGLEKHIRDQIDMGSPAIPMTKEQVFMAVGYPSHIDEWMPADELTREQIFTSNHWIYRYNEIMWIPSWYHYFFDNDGLFRQRSPP